MNNYKTRLIRDVLEMSAVSAVGWQRVTDLLTDIETIASASDNIEINDTSIPTTNAVQTIVDNTMVNNDYITLVSASDISTATITDDTVPTTSAVQKVVNDSIDNHECISIVSASEVSTTTITDDTVPTTSAVKKLIDDELNDGFVTSAESTMTGDLIMNNNAWKKFDISEHIDIVSADNFTYDNVNDNTVPTTSAVKKLVDDMTANMAISVSGITIKGDGAYFYGLNETNSKLNEAVIWKNGTSTYLSYIEGYTEYMGRNGIAYTDSKQKLNTVVHATDYEANSFDDSWLIHRDNTWSIGDQLIFKSTDDETYIGTINSWYTIRSTDDSAIITDAILIALSSDNGFVHIVGTETITGKKTFTDAIDIKKDNSSGSTDASNVRVIWPQATGTERRFNLGYENNGNRGLWDSVANCWAMQIKGDTTSAVNMSFGKGIDLSGSYTNKIVYGTYNKDMGTEAVVEFGAGTSANRRTPLWLDKNNHVRYATPLGDHGAKVDCELTSPIKIDAYENYTDEGKEGAGTELQLYFSTGGVASLNGNTRFDTGIVVKPWCAIIGILHILIPSPSSSSGNSCRVYMSVDDKIIVSHNITLPNNGKLNELVTAPFQYFNYSNSSENIYMALTIPGISGNKNITIYTSPYFQINSGVVG